jgi:hypothetical protein
MIMDRTSNYPRLTLFISKDTYENKQLNDKIYQNQRDLLASQKQLIIHTFIFGRSSRFIQTRSHSYYHSFFSKYLFWGNNKIN